MPESPWIDYTEWPKLDLPKRHLIQLALAWTVPFSAHAVQQFAGLLDADGSFAGILTYTRGKVRHYRIEAAQVGAEDGHDLVVTVQYQADAGSLPAVPRAAQDGAWLLDCLNRVDVLAPVRCKAYFEFRNAADLQLAIPLPYPPADSDRFSPFDEIRGVRGVKFEDDSEARIAYGFTLDRLPNHDVALDLAFSMEPGPVEQMPDAALRTAAFYAGRIAFKKRK